MTREELRDKVTTILMKGSVEPYLNEDAIDLICKFVESWHGLDAGVQQPNNSEIRLLYAFITVSTDERWLRHEYELREAIDRLASVKTKEEAEAYLNEVFGRK